MICPKCYERVITKDSRAKDAQSIRRVKECIGCRFRFRTIEVPTQFFRAFELEINVIADRINSVVRCEQDLKLKENPDD